MERFYFDIGIVSVYVGREQSRDLGVRFNEGSTELWAGKTYVCADFSRRHIVKATRTCIYIATAFIVGLFIDPPDFADAAIHTVQDKFHQMFPPI
jgi:hypothetical protein